MYIVAQYNNEKRANDQIKHIELLLEGIKEACDLAYERFEPKELIPSSFFSLYPAVFRHFEGEEIFQSSIPYVGDYSIDSYGDGFLGIETEENDDICVTAVTLTNPNDFLTYYVGCDDYPDAEFTMYAMKYQIQAGYLKKENEMLEKRIKSQNEELKKLRNLLRKGEK